MARKIISDWENNDGGYERELMIAYYNINHHQTIRYTIFEGVVRKQVFNAIVFGEEEVYEVA